MCTVCSVRLEGVVGIAGADGEGLACVVMAVVCCEGIVAVLFIGVRVVVVVLLEIGVVLCAVASAADEADATDYAVRHCGEAEILRSSALVRVV